MAGKCLFNKKWMETYPWIDEFKGDRQRAVCKLCKSDFSVANKGIGAVKQHLKGLDHQRSENAAANTMSIDRLIQSIIFEHFRIYFFVF